MGCMVYAVARSKEHLAEDYEPDLDGDFQPNMINSVVFLVGAVQQVCENLLDHSFGFSCVASVLPGALC